MPNLEPAQQELAAYLGYEPAIQASDPGAPLPAQLSEETSPRDWFQGLASNHGEEVFRRACLRLFANTGFHDEASAPFLSSVEAFLADPGQRDEVTKTLESLKPKEEVPSPYSWNPTGTRDLDDVLAEQAAWRSPAGATLADLEKQQQRREAADRLLAALAESSDENVVALLGACQGADFERVQVELLEDLGVAGSDARGHLVPLVSGSRSRPVTPPTPAPTSAAEPTDLVEEAVDRPAAPTPPPVQARGSRGFSFVNVLLLLALVAIGAVAYLQSIGWL